MSQPTTEPNPTPIPSTTAPIAEPVPTTTAANNQTTEAAESLTLKQKLDAAEQHWIWKASLRVIVIVVSLIGIGCIAWAVSTVARYPFRYDLDEPWAMWWGLITFSVSIIWCLTCILVLLFRRPNRPVAPGAAVGLDLVLWLAYIVTALFALVAVFPLVSWGDSGEVSLYSSDGRYLQAPNGTWVWNATDYSSYSGYSNYYYNEPEPQPEERECAKPEQYGGYYDSDYTSCAEEDAYVNKIWEEKPHRVKVIYTGIACQFIALALHLVLFIWACVDTHRRRRGNVSKDAEKLAADIVMNMVRSGAIVRPQDQGAMQQPLLHPQPLWQGWQRSHSAPAGPAPMGQYALQPMVPQPVALGPEKGESSRFA